MGQRTIQSRSAHYPQAEQNMRANRAGATTVIGGAYFVDASRSDAASTTVATALDNIVGVTTALMAKRPILVIAAEAVADDGDVNVFEGDGVICRARVDANSPNIAAGDWLKPANGSTDLVKATYAAAIDEAGSAVHTINYARALEAATADNATILIQLFSTGIRG